MNINYKSAEIWIKFNQNTGATKKLKLLEVVTAQSTFKTVFLQRNRENLLAKTLHTDHAVLKALLNYLRESIRLRITIVSPQKWPGKP